MMKSSIALVKYKKQKQNSVELYYTTVRECFSMLILFCSWSVQRETRIRVLTASVKGVPTHGTAEKRHANRSKIVHCVCPANLLMGLLKDTCTMKSQCACACERERGRGERERERVNHESSDSESSRLKNTVWLLTWTYRWLLHFRRGLAVGSRQTGLNEGVHGHLSPCTCRVEVAGCGCRYWSVEIEKRSTGVGSQGDEQEWGRWRRWDRGMHFRGIQALAAASGADWPFMWCVHLEVHRL